METKTNIAQAILAVMKDVKGIDKSMTVGSGNNSYKGVPDQEVKKIIGESMEKHGLCLLPTGVDAKTRVDRWEEENTYNGVTTKKMKQSVFTESKTRYLLLHTSGESIELEGYGQGVDSQDKSAGKSTTYALKYTLLYTFLVPTGKIDDADTTHSDDIQTPQKKAPVQVKEAPESERVANMQKQKSVDISEHKELIAKIPSAVGLTGYYTALSNEDKANTEILALLTARRGALQVNVKTP
jgi:hypothetical protein